MGGWSKIYFIASSAQLNCGLAELGNNNKTTTKYLGNDLLVISLVISILPQQNNLTSGHSKVS